MVWPRFAHTAGGNKWPCHPYLVSEKKVSPRSDSTMSLEMTCDPIDSSLKMSKIAQKWTRRSRKENPGFSRSMRGHSREWLLGDDDYEDDRSYRWRKSRPASDRNLGRVSITSSRGLVWVSVRLEVLRSLYNKITLQPSVRI